MLVVGAAAFCALGLALSAAIPNADAAAAPIVNAMILPLLFLSGIFIPLSDSTPSWILVGRRGLPRKHFAVGHAGRLRRHAVRLGRCRGRRRLGRPRPTPGRPLTSAGSHAPNTPPWPNRQKWDRIPKAEADLEAATTPRNRRCGAGGRREPWVIGYMFQDEVFPALRASVATGRCGPDRTTGGYTGTSWSESS